MQKNSLFLRVVVVPQLCSRMHGVIARKFNTLPETFISAKEANNHLTCQAVMDEVDMGSWGELAVEYLEFKKKRRRVAGAGQVQQGERKSRCLQHYGCEKKPGGKNHLAL